MDLLKLHIPKTKMLLSRPSCRKIKIPWSYIKVFSFWIWILRDNTMLIFTNKCTHFVSTHLILYFLHASLIHQQSLKWEPYFTCFCFKSRIILHSMNRKKRSYVKDACIARPASWFNRIEGHRCRDTRFSYSRVFPFILLKWLLAYIVYIDGSILYFDETIMFGWFLFLMHSTFLLRTQVL